MMNYSRWKTTHTFEATHVVTASKIASFLVSVILLSGCSKSLDVQCSALFEEVSGVLDTALSLDVRPEQDQLVAQLDVLLGDIDALQKAVDKFHEKKRPRDTFRDDPNAPLVRDDLQWRKIRALNAYLTRSNELGLYGDSYGFKKDSATKLRTLSRDCNRAVMR